MIKEKFLVVSLVLSFVFTNKKNLRTKLKIGSLTLDCALPRLFTNERNKFYCLGILRNDCIVLCYNDNKDDPELSMQCRMQDSVSVRLQFIFSQFPRYNNSLLRENTNFFHIRWCDITFSISHTRMHTHVILSSRLFVFCFEKSFRLKEYFPTNEIFNRFAYLFN